VLATPTPGIGPLLQETWERYGLPVAVTEAHIDANREDQLRWLVEIWDAARHLRARVADIRAVTVWALLGSYDWNCLVTECRGYYEPGPYDVRGAASGQPPRATAVADLMRRLATGRPPLWHPVLQGEGWWRRPERFKARPVDHAVPGAALRPQGRSAAHVQPILIAGAAGALGSAFAQICRQRNLACRIVTREEMDIADPASVEAAIARHWPWAIVNAGGYVHIDQAERNADECFRNNTLGPAVLALACTRHGLQLTTFSSGMVFDGESTAPYVESSAVAPLNVYGRSKAMAERRVLDSAPESLVIRTSALFSPWNGLRGRRTARWGASGP